MDERKTAIRLSVLGIIANCFLVVLKLAAGAYYGSSALISDGVHSLADLLTTLAAVLCYFLSKAKKKCDKIEYIASYCLGVVLIITGATIGLEGLRKLLFADYSMISYSLVPLFAAISAVLIKWLLYRVTYSQGKRINSPVFAAEGLHHRADAMSSLCTVIGIAGGKLGVYHSESIASVFMAFLICKMGYSIFAESGSRLRGK